LSSWQPIETAPKNEEAMFWIRPLTKAEAWCNTNGKPIFIDSPPELFVGKHGRWSSLWTATHWMPMPEGPSLETVALCTQCGGKKWFGEVPCSACNAMGEVTTVNR
jgi:hypothetical protein